jgi:hypothetical protein
MDRTYSLDDIAAAHEYVDTGRKRGSVVVDLMCRASTPGPGSSLFEAR